MKIARLALGAFCTLIAAAVARRLSAARWLRSFSAARFSLSSSRALQAWPRFPVWYHLTFLCSLIPLALLGARLPRAKTT